MSDPTSRKPALSFVFVTMLLAVIGFGLLIPVLPQLVVEFQGNNVAAGAHAYGSLVSIFSLMQFFASPILGALSDRFGRRRLILIATAGAAIDYVIMANAPTLSWLFVARMISGMTAGVLATANAYLVDVTPPEKRAQSFGILGAAFGLGLVVGPALGGVLGHFSLRLPFWFAAGCAALNWLWGYFVLPESLKPENRRAFSWRRANPVGALMTLQRFPAVLGLSGSYFCSWLAQTLLQATWALYTQQRYGWGTLQVGLSLMLTGVLMGLVQVVLVKRFVPKLGETRAVIFGSYMSMAAMIGYGLAPYGWMIFAIMPIGSLAGLATPALQAYVSKHIPANEQGAVQGVFNGLASLANIPGPFIGAWSFGWAISSGSTFHLPGIAFFEAAVLVFIGLLLALRSFRNDQGTATLEPEKQPEPVAP